MKRKSIISISPLNPRNADKSFLRNDIGHDNLDLINQKIFSEDMESNSLINTTLLNDFLIHLFCEYLINNKINNLMII